MNSLNNAHRSVSECLKCNVKITFLLLFLFFIVYPSQSYAQSAYAVLNNTVLTFYYDGLKNDRVGEKFIMNTGTSFPEWMDNGGGTGSYNNNNITKVVFDEQFQYYRPTSCYYWFSGCNKLTEIVGLEYLNTSDVTNMSHMFYYCDYLNSIDVSHFNTAKVTDMAYMFGFCSSVTSLDFSSFNTSNVTDMSYMFCYANRLSLADLTTFNTDKVTNMGYMFDNSGVSVCLLNNFNVSKVENMSSMFHNCQGLTTVMVDASKWNATQVTSSTDMFMDCYQIIGNNGTTYDPNQKDKAYAHIDGGDYNPGYLTSGDYKILYTLNEGSLPAGKTNPSSFPAPKNTSVLYLEEPVKEGYTFSGWTGTPTTGLGYSPTLNVSIPVGATGNRIYNAHYTINKYKITLPEHFEFVNTNSNVGVFDFNSTVEFKVTDGYKAVGDVKNGSTVLSPENGIYSIKVPANDVTISGTAKKVISLSVAINDWTYGSTPNTPTVKKDNVEISLNDVSVKYTDKNNQEITPSSTTPAGTYNLTVSYPETATEISASIGTTFTINPYIISATDPKLSITLNPTSFTYDGNKKEPSVTVNYDGKEIPSSEYTVKYKNNINAGTATAEIEDNQGGNYTINGSKDFTINPYIISATDPKLSITLNPTSFTYDGNKKEPSVTVNYDGKEIPSSEYTVNYKNNINVGTATADIFDNDGGNYTVNGSKDFTINPLVIDPADPKLSITLNPSSFTYDGNKKEPSVTVNYDGKEIPSSEYTVKYKNNINAGTATAEIEDNQGGNYTINGSKDFTINPYIISATDPKLSITLNPTSFTYDGNKKEPSVTVNYDGVEIPSSEYTVNYKNNINVGTATAEIEDNQGGNYTINGSKDFSITPLVIDPTDPKLSITLNPNTYTYDGTAKEPDVTVSYDGTEIPSSEYTVNYKNNILVGTATAEIEDNDGGNYTVNGSKDFSIIPLEIDLNDPTIASLLSIVLNPDSYIYDGKAKEPEVTITFNGVEIPSAEYTVSYQDNINVGTATAIIADNQGGNYTVNGTAPFTINPLVVDPTDPNLSIVLENDTYKYTGSPIEPKVTITYNGTTIPSSEYTVSYKDNTNVGTATVIITDNPNGNFTISGTTPFTITPGPIYITTANTDTDGAILADASNKNFCSGKAVIEFTAQNGTLDNYSIEFDGDKISAQNGAISGNSIEIALPKDLLPGSYNGFMELTSFDGNSTGKLPIRVVVKLPYYTIVTLYNDVAAVNQLAGEFSAYKWTENGKEISGADSRLLQYRFEKKSVYTAILTKIDGGSYETCPLDLSRVTTSTNTEVNVYPNPGNSLSDVFVEVTNNYQPDADSHIYIYHLNGRLAKEIKTPQEKNTIQLPTGNYSGVYIQNGEKVPFKLIIK